MRKKKVTVETCQICDEWKFLIKCGVCGRKFCGNPNKHISTFMSFWEVIGDQTTNDWYYAPYLEKLWICVECQQKPFIEIWQFAQKLGWIAC